jgi:uncharacterized Zn finger protein
MDEFEEMRPPTVAEIREKAKKMQQELAHQGRKLHPVVVIHSRNLAKNFWGKAWMKSLAACELYYKRLSSGRTYLRNGCVLDMQITPGNIHALVCGNDLYETCASITPPDSDTIERLREKCASRIDSWLDLLQGKISPEVMDILCDPDEGLLPRPEEWQFSCTCPDWADLCKHVAASLYGFGVLLDEQPDLLFTLRNIKASDLIPECSCAPNSEDGILDKNSESLSNIFGIDLSNIQ